MCVRFASNHELIEKNINAARSFLFHLFPTAMHLSPVHLLQSAQYRRADRQIVFATFESRRAAFLSTFSFAFRFPSIRGTHHDILSLLSPERTRCDYLSSRRKLTGFLLGKGLRTIRDNLE